MDEPECSGTCEITVLPVCECEQEQLPENIVVTVGPFEGECNKE